MQKFMATEQPKESLVLTERNHIHGRKIEGCTLETNVRGGEGQ